MDDSDNEKITCLLKRLKDGENIAEDEITSVLTKLIQSCHVPKLDRAEDFPYSESDFAGVADVAEYCLAVIYRVIEELNTSCKNGRKFSILFMRNIVTDSFLVASEYSDAEWDWSSERAALSAKNIIDKLCFFIGCSNLKEFLNGSISDVQDRGDSRSGEVTNNYLEYILQTLTITLNKKSWKIYVASKASYWFILTNLDDKILGNYLAYLLPPALFIVDDWEQRHKIFGLKCLRHILKNVTGSEIRWYGRAMVIYEAVKNHLYSRETAVLEELYPTIIAIAEIIEADPECTGRLRSADTYDTIMQQLMQEMRYEQKLTLRVVYSAAMPILLNAMGILAVKWSDDIMSLCEDYLATYSGPLAEDRINILKGLQVYIQKSWPQIHFHAASILKMVIRLLYDVTSQDSDLDVQVVDKLIKEALQVVRLLHIAAPKTSQELCEGLTNAEVHPKCQHLLKAIEDIVSSE